MAKNTVEVTNYNFCSETIFLKETIERSFLELGERLMKIRNGNLYLPTWSSFSEYLMEMGLSEARASKLIGIFEKYVIMGGIDPKTLITAKGWSGLAEFLPFIKNPQDAAKFAHLATTLSRDDQRKEKYEMKTGKLMKDCPHEDTYTVEICKTCGDKKRIYEE